jgi:transposase
MTIFGCDISKDTVDSVLLSPHHVILKRFCSANTVEELTKILQELKNDFSDLCVGCESTGIYHQTLVEACDALGIPCKLLNPILTKEFNRSSIRKKKTDRDDALVIAKLLAQGEGNIIHFEDCIDRLKTIVRSVRKIGDLSRSLLLHARHAGKLLPDEVTLYEHAQHELLTLQKALRKSAVTLCDSPLRPLLESIPGIGAWSASVILAETRNFRCCRNADAFVAFAGLDPRVQQSGTTLNHNGRLTKRGSPHLRAAIFMAANVARIYDPELRAYYDKRKLQGQKFTAITCALSRKLCYRIFAVIKRKTPYEVHEKQS